MEFKFRAGDDRPSTTTVRYFSSERTIRGQSVLPSWAVVSPPPVNPGQTRPDPTPALFPDYLLRDPILHPTNARDALQRQMEKDRIREEILAAETARRLVLEAEVRRELMLERQLAMKKDDDDGLWFEDPCRPMQAQSFDHRFGFSFRSSSPSAMVPRLPEPAPGKLEVNKELTPAASSPELNKGRLIVLAKPNPDLSGLKRKLLPSEGLNEIHRYTMRKKKKIHKEVPEEIWSCALCQVTVANEKTFEGHLNGRKHKASERRLGAEKLGNSSSNAPILKNIAKLSEPKVLETTDAASLQIRAKERCLLDPNEASDGSDKKDTSILKEKTSEEKKVELPVQEDQCGEDSRNNVVIRTVHMMQRKEEPTKTKKFEFVCEICKVGSNNFKVMEKHGRGKKHMDKLKELLENKLRTTIETNVNIATTKSLASSGASQEALHRLQQDTKNSIAAANVIEEANASIPTTIAVASLGAPEKAETTRLQEYTYVTKGGNVSMPTAVAVPTWGASEETEPGRLLEEILKNNVPTSNATKDNVNVSTTKSSRQLSSWATEAAENFRKLEAYEKLIKARLTE